MKHLQIHTNVSMHAESLMQVDGRPPASREVQSRGYHPDPGAGRGWPTASPGAAQQEPAEPGGEEAAGVYRSRGVG